MKKFEQPKLEIVRFDSCDVIATSISATSLLDIEDDGRATEYSKSYSKSSADYNSNLNY